MPGGPVPAAAGSAPCHEDPEGAELCRMPGSSSRSLYPPGTAPHATPTAGRAPCRCGTEVQTGLHVPLKPAHRARGQKDPASRWPGASSLTSTLVTAKSRIPSTPSHPRDPPHHTLSGDSPSHQPLLPGPSPAIWGPDPSCFSQTPAPGHPPPDLPARPASLGFLPIMSPHLRALALQATLSACVFPQIPSPSANPQGTPSLPCFASSALTPAPPGGIPPSPVLKPAMRAAPHGQPCVPEGDSVPSRATTSPAPGGPGSSPSRPGGPHPAP